MNLDELIKAAQNPTSELMEEISESILNKLSEQCGEHDWDDGIEGGPIYRCKKCPAVINEHSSKAGDYTKLENFWPLLDEILLKHNGELHYTECENRYKLYFGAMFQEDKITHENPGLAVCLAYLKVKERENDA